MNNFVNSRVMLPTADIFTEDTLKQSPWLGFSSSTTMQEFINAGYILLPEPTAEQGDGDILVADKTQSGDIIASWMPQTEYAAIINNRCAGAVVRAKRNLLLSESDWTQGKDIPDSISSKWTTYRQALRDITSQEGFPNNVQWPQMP